MSNRADRYDPYRTLLHAVSELKGITFENWETLELLSKVTPHLIEAPPVSNPHGSPNGRKAWSWPRPSRVLAIFLNALNTDPPKARVMSWGDLQAWAQRPQWDVLSKYNLIDAAAMVYRFWLLTFQAIVDARLRKESERTIIHLFEAWAHMAKAKGFPKRLRPWIRLWNRMLQYTLAFQPEEVHERTKRGTCGHYFIDPTKANNKKSCSTRCRVTTHRAKLRKATLLRAKA